MAPPLLHDLACVVHLHSTHSDGTGTVDQIVAAGQKAGVDAILLTDHDTLAGKSEEGWHGNVLLLVDFHLVQPAVEAKLLKTIEEPPADTIFIVLAETVSTSLEPIASRCVRIEVDPLSPRVVQAALEDVAACMPG